MLAIDTNILVYAHFDRYPQHEKARAFVEEQLLAGNDWCLGWQIYYEYLRIVTHPRVHEKPLTLAKAMADLEPYLSSPSCQVLTHSPQHHQVLAALSQRFGTVSGNHIHDFHYAALLFEHGVKRIATADADFRRFDFLEVMDPTA